MGCICPVPLQWSPCSTFMAFCAYHRIAGQKSKLHVLNLALESVYVLPPKTHMYKEPAIISAWMPHGSLIVVLRSSSNSSAGQVFCSSPHTPDNASVCSQHAKTLLAEICQGCAVCGLAFSSIGGFAVLTQPCLPAEVPDKDGCTLHILNTTQVASMKVSDHEAAQLIWSPTSEHLILRTRFAMQLLNSSCVVLLSCALGVGASVAFSPDARHVGAVHKPEGSEQHVLRLYNAHDGLVAYLGAQGGMRSCCTLTFAARGYAVLLGSYKAVSVFGFGEHSLGLTLISVMQSVRLLLTS